MDKLLIYQILPRLWGRGRFSDIDGPTLSYVKSLGMDCIWYTGIPRHSSGQSYTKGQAGSPYSISDYYDVNPYMADNEDERMSEFESLISRSHSAGLRVITDFVPNHVSPDYSDAHGGIKTFDYCDFDWTDTRKIDYGYPGNRERLRDILLFWASKGVDGFRCDMVEMVPPDFFTWAIAEVRRQYPSVFFVAEVYNRENYRKYISEVGFDLLYDKSGSYDLLRAATVCGSSARAISSNWMSLGDLQPHMLNFLENHDEQRIASRFFAGKAEKGYAALSVSMLLNEASFLLYFGQEVGEEAALSPTGRTSIFDIEDVPAARELYSFIHGGKGLCALRRRILSRYRAMLRLCSSPLFRSGRMYDLCYCSDFDRDRIFAFARGDGRRTCIVAANFSDSPAEIVVTVPEEARSYLGIRSGAIRDSGVRMMLPSFDMQAVFVGE